MEINGWRLQIITSTRNIYLNKRNGTVVKNKFYSRLRKGIRSINYLIQNYLNEKWCQFKLDIAFKLINCAANKYDYSERSVIGKIFEEKITFVEGINGI